MTLINDRKDIVWHRHGVAINKRNNSSDVGSSIKSAKANCMSCMEGDGPGPVPAPAPDRVLLHFWSAGSLLQRRTLFALAHSVSLRLHCLFIFFVFFFSLSLLLYRNFICWRIFHRLVRWQQLARICPCIRTSSRTNSSTRLARECGN